MKTIDGVKLGRPDDEPTTDEEIVIKDAGGGK